MTSALGKNFCVPEMFPTSYVITLFFFTWVSVHKRSNLFSAVGDRGVTAQGGHCGIRVAPFDVWPSLQLVKSLPSLGPGFSPVGPDPHKVEPGLCEPLCGSRGDSREPLF